MKKIKEVDYYECDTCKKEAKPKVKCSVCQADLCRDCYISPDIGNYTLCSKCNTDTVKDLVKRFNEEWAALMKRHDKVTNKLFDKYKTKLKEVIETKVQ